MNRRLTGSVLLADIVLSLGSIAIANDAAPGKSLLAAAMIPREALATGDVTYRSTFFVDGRPQEVTNIRFRWRGEAFHCHWTDPSTTNPTLSDGEVCIVYEGGIYTRAGLTGSLNSVLSDRSSTVGGFDPRLLGISPSPRSRELVTSGLYQNVFRGNAAEVRIVASGGSGANPNPNPDVPMIEFEIPAGWRVRFYVDEQRRVVRAEYPDGAYDFLSEYASTSDVLPATVHDRRWDNDEEGYRIVSTLTRVTEPSALATAGPELFGWAGVGLSVGSEAIDLQKHRVIGYWDGEKLVDRRDVAYANALERGAQVGGGISNNALLILAAAGLPAFVLGLFLWKRRV